MLPLRPFSAARYQRLALVRLVINPALSKHQSRWRADPAAYMDARHVHKDTSAVPPPSRRGRSSKHRRLVRNSCKATSGQRLAVLGPLTNGETAKNMLILINKRAHSRWVSLAVLSEDPAGSLS